jgi:hypothetical protein
LKSYLTDILPDGTLLVWQTNRKRRQYFWVYFLFGTAWTLVNLLIFGGGGSYPPPDDGFRWHKVVQAFTGPSAWWVWLFLSFGPCVVWHALSMLLVREVWCAKPNSLDVRSYFGKFLYRVRRYRDCDLRIERLARHDSDEGVVTGDNWFFCLSPIGNDNELSWRQLDFWITKPKETPQELLTIGESLAKKTGWRLRQTEDDLSSEGKNVIRKNR